MFWVIFYFCVFVGPLLGVLSPAFLVWGEPPQLSVILWSEVCYCIFYIYLLLDFKRSVVSPILLVSSISLHWSLRKVFLSLLAILWNSVFKCVYLSFFPGGSAGKESTCNVGDMGSIPVLGRSPREGNGYPIPFWPGEFHELYSLWGCKESDMTEQLSLSLSIGGVVMALLTFLWFVSYSYNWRKW